MTNYYIPLFLTFIALASIQIHIFSKRYSRKLSPFLINEKIDWDPNIDRLKLLISTTILFIPSFLMRALIKFNSNNSIFNHIALNLLIALALFLIWFDLKKIPKLPPLTKETDKTKTVKAGRKKISQYKLVALKYLLEEKFYGKDSFLQSDKNRITICEIIVDQEQEITNSGSLKNDFNKLTKENLDNLFKKDKYKAYVPILLEDDFIKEKTKIKLFLEKFQ